MSDKRKKMHGEIVSNEHVLDRLGDPSEWARLARRVEKDRRLAPGENDLDIAGLRGFGARGVEEGGYLGFLEAQLAQPSGAGTSLVSPETNERIRLMVLEETRLEIAVCMSRLGTLEKSASAVAKYIADMRLRIEKSQLQATVIGLDIERYTKLLATLDPNS